MHATIQKPIDEILSYLKSGERVLVVGCGNCAAKCHSGGEVETKEMAERLKQKGVKVAGMGLYWQWGKPVQAHSYSEDAE